jgi:hypothetical protein
MGESFAYFFCASNITLLGRFLLAMNSKMILDDKQTEICGVLERKAIILLFILTSRE